MLAHRATSNRPSIRGAQLADEPIPYSGPVVTKRCNRCKENLPLADFCSNSRRKDGLNYQCRKCAKTSRVYRDSYRAKARAWKENNADRVKEVYQIWALKNAEAERIRWAEYRAIHREESRRYASQRRVLFPDKVRETVVKYNRNNPEALRTRWRNRRSRKRQAEGSHSAGEIISLAEKQKQRCANPSCKVSIRKSFHADHIVPLVLGGSNWISNIQLLCPPCNLKKYSKDPIEWARESGRLL